MGKINYSKINNKSVDDVIMTSCFKAHPCIRVLHWYKFDEDPKLFRHKSRWWKKRAQIEGPFWRRRSGRKNAKKSEQKEYLLCKVAKKQKKGKISFFAKLRKSQKKSEQKECLFRKVAKKPNIQFLQL